jgi:hypothetical protein
MRRYPLPSSQPEDHRTNLLTASKILAGIAIGTLVAGIALSVFIAFPPVGLGAAALTFTAAGYLALTGIGVTAMVGSVICFGAAVKLRSVFDRP